MIDQMQRTTRLMTTRISIITCKLWNGLPATEAMSVDEGDELLVFFRRPWPFLQSRLVAARFPPHPCQLLAFDFGSSMISRMSILLLSLSVFSLRNLDSRSLSLTSLLQSLETDLKSVQSFVYCCSNPATTTTSSKETEKENQAPLLKLHAN